VAGAPGGGGSGVGGDPGTEGDGDFVIGPTYSDSPDLAVKNVPHGTTYNFTMNSTMSTLFPGTDSTLLPENQHSFTRAIRVYVPKQYVDGTEAPFLIVQDGYVDDVAKALDNLIADPQPERRVPAMVAVFVANGGGDSKGSERGLEYDTMSDRYARFIDTEVLPAVQNNSAIKAAYPNLKFTSNPDGRAAYGCSSGGAAAFTMGWFTPNYRRLITYSGTFVDAQDDDAPTEVQYPYGAWEYHQRLIAAADAKPLRVFLQVGENDNGATAPESGRRNWVLANQRMAAALKAKGYHYRYVFAMGASHCDARVRRQTLPDTLRWMWRGYPVN
jgi:enterochelin esterase-like enzyme